MKAFEKPEPKRSTELSFFGRGRKGVKTDLLIKLQNSPHAHLLISRNVTFMGLTGKVRLKQGPKSWCFRCGKSFNVRELMRKNKKYFTSISGNICYSFLSLYSWHGLSSNGHLTYLWTSSHIFLSHLSLCFEQFLDF